MKVRFIPASDTRENWLAKNPVALPGEICVEIDTGRWKFGDGRRPYSELPYAKQDFTQEFFEMRKLAAEMQGAENNRQSTFETNETERQNEFETNEDERENTFEINESVRHQHAEERYGQLEEEYAPKLTEVTAQLAQKATKAEVNALIGDLADATPEFANGVSEMLDTSKLYVNLIDGLLYNHNGTSWISTDIQYQSTGIADKSVTSDKRTALGERAAVSFGNSGVIPNIDTVGMKIDFPSTFYVIHGKNRYTIAEGKSISYESLASLTTSFVIYFNVATTEFLIARHNGLTSVVEDCVFFASLSLKNGSFLSADMPCEYTVDGKQRFVSNINGSIGTSNLANGASTYGKRTRLGERATILLSSTATELPNLNTVTKTLDIPYTFFILSGNIRYTVTGGASISYESARDVSFNVIFYYDTVKGTFLVVPQNVLGAVNDDCLFIAALIDAPTTGGLYMDISCDYTIDGKPRFMPYDGLVSSERPYELTIERVTGDLPQPDMQGVGDVGNPFDRNSDDHVKVYGLYDELVAQYSFVTRELEGNSTNGVPIYSYHIRPERALVTSGGQPKPYPKILLDSSIHGGENMGTDTLYFVFKKICEGEGNYGFLRDYVNFSIVPLPNPEDFNNKEYEGIDGVNLNRNFDYNWSQQAGTGAIPFSRVESQVMRDFFLKHTDALIFIDCHVRGSVLTSDSTLMWLGSSGENERPILSNTAEKLSRKWKQKYPELNNVEGQLGYISGGTASGTIRGYVHHIIGIPSILWEGFKASPTLNDFEGKDVVDMNVEFLGETILNVVKHTLASY